MRKRNRRPSRAVGTVLLAVVAALAWGCASSTCEVEPALKNRLGQVRRQLRSLEKDHRKYPDLYAAGGVIGREVADIEARVERLLEPDACEQVNGDVVTVLERRLAAAEDAVFGNCLDLCSQKRVELDSRSDSGVQPASPADLPACVDRLAYLDNLLNKPSKPRPCADEPATLEDVRRAKASGSGVALGRLKTKAHQRLMDLAHRLDDLMQRENEPSPEERAELDTALECAGSWIMALGDGGLAARFRQLRDRLGNLEAHRDFRIVCHQILDEADAGRLDDLSPEELQQRRTQVDTLFGRLVAPSRSEADLKGSVVSAIDRAAEQGLRRQAQEATASCDMHRFQTAINGLEKLGAAAADLKERFRASCTENLDELARRLDASLREVRSALQGGNLGAQDRAMERFLAQVSTAESLSPQGREQLAQRVDMGAVEEMRPCAQALLEGDRALNAGDLASVESAYRRARGVPGCRAGRLRKARAQRLRASRSWQRGDLEGAWSLLSGVAAVLGSSVRQDQIKLARQGVRTSAEGSAERLRWLRRLRSAAGLGGLRPDELLELAALTADRASKDPKLWQKAWDALAAYFGADPASPPLNAFILASRIAHAVDVTGHRWASGAWGPGGAVHINQFVAWCDRYGPRLGSGMAARLKNLVSYQEILYLASEALQSLWDEVQELDRPQREHVRSGVLRKLLNAISKAPLVRSAGIGSPGGNVDTEVASLIRQAMGQKLAVSRNGQLVAASTGSLWGTLVLVFDSGAAASPGATQANLRDRLAVARAEALGTVAGLLVEMTSGRMDLPIDRRKAAVFDIIQGLRYRMGSNVLAYAGLFNRDGMLEVPRRPGEFFLDRDLAAVGVPVFQDDVSRKAVAAESLKVQRFNLKGRHLADVAVPIRRGRNRMGVLRLGVTQSGGPES